MNRPKDPAFEMRDALDREVRRRLDPDALCAALEEEARSAPVIHGGPLSRVPAAVQWVGIAAAVIAALTGLRSVYVDLTSTPEPAPQVVELAAVEPERPEAAEPTIVAPREEVEPTLPEPAKQPEPSPELETPPTAPAEDLPPAPAEIVETPAEEPEPTAIAQKSPGFVATAPGRLQQASPPQRRTPPPRPSASQPAPDTPTQPAPIVTQSGTTVASVTGGVEFGQPGVRDATFRTGNVRLNATVSEVPNLGATLVSFWRRRGAGVTPERPSPASGSSQSNPTTVVASSVDYHLRLLVGSSFEQLPENRHAWLDTEAEVVPFLSNLWFGTDPQKAVLTELFDLRSIVASDNVRIPVDDGFADTTLVASAAGRIYELSVRVEPEETGSDRRLQVRISRRFGDRAPRKAPVIEASLGVDDGRVVLIAVPEQFLDRRHDPATDEDAMMFVAVATGSEEIAKSTRRREDRIVERPDNPAILVDGGHVDYPDEAIALGLAADGRIKLRALVAEDGRVHAIQVLEAPTFDGAELIVENAAGAVRGWSYLPAQDRGRPVATWVEVELEF